MYSQMPRELKERVTSSGLVTHETDDIIKKYILHSLWADAQEHRSRSTTLFQAVCSDHIHRDIAWVSRTRNMYRVVTENLIVGPELVEGRMYPTWTPIDITVAPPPVVGGRMYPTWNPSERNVAPSAVRMQ